MRPDLPDRRPVHVGGGDEPVHRTGTPVRSLGVSDEGTRPPDGTVAVVLTFRRRRLATQVVRQLVSTEGFRPGDVVLVVNGDGGLDDAELEASVRVERLAENIGPAGGFRHGLLVAAAIPGTRWIYLCEDDIGVLDIPAPRVARLIAEAEAYERAVPGRPVGGVVPYGRRLDRRSGGTSIYTATSDSGFDEIDAAAWGASLVPSRVVEAGVLPDETWFFGYEDFDFWFRVKAAGFRVLVDRASATATACHMTSAGWDEALSAERPIDAQEPWRAYYVARNFFLLSRRHGTVLWTANHLAYSARRMQLARSRASRVATLQGLWDGLRGRRGRNPRFQRVTGELPER